MWLVLLGFLTCSVYAADYVWIGGDSGSLNAASNWDPAPPGAFTGADKLIVNSAKAITIDSSVTVEEIRFANASSLDFTAAEGVTLTVGKVASTGTGAVTFSCPVKFSSTYHVYSESAYVKFPGGATATFPDNGLRTADSTLFTRTLDGVFSFTADWSVNDVGDYPWIVASGSTVRAKALTGTQKNRQRILRVEKGGEAYFTTIAIGYNNGDIDVDGYVEVEGDVVVTAETSDTNFGRSGNTGTIKARRFAKDGSTLVKSLIPNLIVGAGGLGCQKRDYYWLFAEDTVITVVDDFDFFQAELRTADTRDWGLCISEHKTLTIDIPEGKTVNLGIGITGDHGKLVKKGAGTLVMSDSYNGMQGFRKSYGQGTAVEAGTLQVMASDSIGSRDIDVAAGARLVIGDNVSLNNRVHGDGTVVFGNNVSIENGWFTWIVGNVEFSSPTAAVTVNTEKISGLFAFMTNVKPEDVSRFTSPNGTLSLVGGALAVNSAPVAGAYVWAGESGADSSSPSSWLVDGATPAAAPGASDTVWFANTSPVTVGGTSALTVGKIVTVSDKLVDFACPVKFATTYHVEAAARAPRFTGGATGTVPDAAMTDYNNASHMLDGIINFTEDWAIPEQHTDSPFVVLSGTRLTGKKLTGVTYSATKPVLKLVDGSLAIFDEIQFAGKLLVFLEGGKLLVNGDATYGAGGGRDLGYYYFANHGTIEANGIYKNVTGGGATYVYFRNIVVGAGGFGMLHKDYATNFQRDARVTAKADFAVHKPIDGTNENDWGIYLQGNTVTFDTAGHTITFDSLIDDGTGRLVKEGEGEMIMQGFTKRHTSGTDVKAGKMTVKIIDGTGYGTTTVYDGANLHFTEAALAQKRPVHVKAGGLLSSDVAVSFVSDLTLEAGAVVSAAQNRYFDVSRGTLNLPAEGKVSIDLTGFTFVNGVAVTVFQGVGPSDASKFEAILPEGLAGEFSVVGDSLAFTLTAGGADSQLLTWNPTGESIWSETVAAWSNAGGLQVPFSPLAKAQIAKAATIEVPGNVLADTVTVATDDDVVLNGAGKIGGTAPFVKKGEGDLVFNVAGGIEAQTIIVSNGFFKVGEALGGNALGSAGDGSPVVVAPGGTFDLNYSAESTADVAKSKVTRDKLFRISGDGADGNGAIVNNRDGGASAHHVLSDIVLEDDASVGGITRFDVRGGVSGYVRNNASIYGPGKVLTVKNTAAFAVINASVDLDSIVVTNGGNLRIEGSTDFDIPNGIRLRDGGILSSYGGVTIPANVTIYSETGDNKLDIAANTPTINAPIVVSEGSSLTHSANNAVYNGNITGNFRLTGGIAYFTNPQPDGWKVFGTGAGRIYLRKSGVYTNADLCSQDFCIGDQADVTLDVTFRDSHIVATNLFLAWGGVCSSSVSFGEGTTVQVRKIAIGDSGTSSNRNVKAAISVDGATLVNSGNDFFIAHNGPDAEFVLNSGLVEMPNAMIRLRNNNQYLGASNKSRFIQNGGTFNYGGAGFLARYEDNNDYGQILLKGGEFNASSNWSIPHYIPVCFMAGAENGWTLNQKAGTAATWNTAIRGPGDVTVNAVQDDESSGGRATLVGDKEVQGAVSGKWTIGSGVTAGLEGASSILGGLVLEDGATASVDIGTGRNAVFTAREFGGEPTDAFGCISNRFNKVIGGTTRGTITHNEAFLFTHYNSANKRPFGDMNYSSAYANGQFYVAEEDAGEWSFKGKSDDWVILYIDGRIVLCSTGRCAEATGTMTLTPGWHSFRHLSLDNGGGFGDAMTAGYKTPRMASFANFSLHNLPMRPGADMGDPNNTNTLRWSSYKGNSSTVTSATFKRDDFNWDFACITNNLQMLQRYGQNDKHLNTYVVNRFEGFFYVTEENADKTWTFHTQYDDRCALWIDEVDSGLTGESASGPTYSVVLSKGWHSFRIQAADFTGSSGPWSGKGMAVSYKVGDGPETLFSEQTLSLSICPDGYIQGGVTLGSGSVLSNTVSGHAAEVYGSFGLADGAVGAEVYGAFKFEGATLDFGTVAANTRDYTELLAFENYAEDFLADVGEIKVNYTAKPKCGKVKVCPAAGLAAEDIQAKCTVTCGGEPMKFRAVIENGYVYFIFNTGFKFIIR